MYDETLVERDWVLGSREGALGKLNSGHKEGVRRNSCHGLFFSSLWPCSRKTQRRGAHEVLCHCLLTPFLSLFYCI